MAKRALLISKWLVVSVLGLILGAGFLSYGYLFSQKQPMYDAVAAKVGVVVQEVSVTGKVKAAESADLSFEKSGRVSAIYTKVGDVVAENKLLLELDASDIEAQLDEAEANLRVQESKLRELVMGTRPEELSIYTGKLFNAKVAFGDAQKNMVNVINDAYTKSDDAVRNKADQFFTNPRSASPQLTFSGADYLVEVDLKFQRLSMEAMLMAWKSSLLGLTSGSNFSVFVIEAQKNLSQTKLFLEKSAIALASAQTNSSISQSTIDGWRAGVSTARSNIELATSNLSGANEKLNTSDSNVRIAENELDLKEAGATSEQIAAQEAQVEQAAASAEVYRVQIQKTLLYAPIGGTVTRQDAKIGEIVSAQTPLVSIINTSLFEIEAYIPEVDIAKVKIGDMARVTLDAYGNDVFFNAEMAAVDPAETIIEGVPTYKTTLHFLKPDVRVKSGMTANVDILTAKKEKVLLIPIRALIRRGSEHFVNVFGADGKLKERDVQPGLRGSDGNIEILAGLKEGELVVR